MIPITIQNIKYKVPILWQHYKILLKILRIHSGCLINFHGLEIKDVVDLVGKIIEIGKDYEFNGKYTMK